MKEKSRLSKALIVILILVLLILGVGFVIGNSIYNFALDPANYSYAVKDDDNTIDIKYIKDEYKNSAEKAKTKSSDDQDLFAYYKQDEDKHDWVMLVHGFNGTDETMPIANDLEKKGYNTLVTENRGYGFSKNSKMTFGRKEKNDIATWTNYIKDIDKDANIYIYGLNMGANDVLLSSNEDLTDVAGIIADSPIINMDAYMDKFLRENFRYGGGMSKTVLDKFMNYKLGYNTNNLGLTPSTKKSSIAIYYIFGEKDNVNTKSDIEKLEESTNNLWGSYTRKGGFLGGYLNEVNVYNDKFISLLEDGSFELNNSEAMANNANSTNAMASNDDSTEDIVNEEKESDSHTNSDPIFDKLAGKEFQYEGRWFNAIRFEENGVFDGIMSANYPPGAYMSGDIDHNALYCFFRGRFEKVESESGDVFAITDLKITSDTGSYVYLGPKDQAAYTQDELNILGPAEPTIIYPDMEEFIVNFDENTFGIEKGINYRLTTNRAGKMQLIGDRGISEAGYIPEFIER